MNEPHKDFLFHYTGAEALLNIVTKRELWASDALYLNDSTDGDVAGKMLGDITKHPQVFFEEGSNANEKLLEAVRLFVGGRFHSTVVAFSSHSWSLPQFRMYGSGDGGYVIGFPREYLQKIGTLVHCDYSGDNLFRWAKKHVVKCLDFVASVDGADKTPQDLCSEMQQKGAQFDEERFVAQVTYKSADFINEGESRLYWRCPGTSFRVSRNGSVITPYHVVSLPNEEIEVMVADGPNRNPDLANLSITALFSAARSAKTKWQFLQYRGGSTFRV